MIVERATEAGDELVEAFARLVPQLSPRARPPSRAEVARLLEQPGIVQLVARADGGIVGVLTLVVLPLAEGLKARIEDVIVDESARGRGIGEALVREAQAIAAEAGARRVELSSAPAREAANRLYRRLGFEQRETNSYVWRPG
jgi:ribosomal protein S18 acetylase RimI-like enzyme